MRVAIETGDPIGPVLADELERRTKTGEFLDYEQLRRLEGAIPEQTTALREVGAAILAQMRAVLGQIPGPGQEVQIEAARVANNLANRLSDLGRREAALQAAEEAAVPVPRAGAGAARRLHARTSPGPSTTWPPC